MVNRLVVPPALICGPIPNLNGDVPVEKGTPVRRDHIWRKCIYPKLKPVGLEWATLQVMRRMFATLSQAAGVDVNTLSAQMGNTVDVNENEYAVASFEQKLAAVRKRESVVIQ